MRNEIEYEWVCEYWTLDGQDIIDSDYGPKLADVYPPRFDNLCSKAKVALKRDVGNNDDGLLDRGYAYSGDTHFSCGHKVPQRFLKDLNSTGE